MITIIHGDDITASRKFFTDKKGASSSPIIDGEKLTLLDIKQQGATGGLFEKAEPLFVENFLTNAKPGKVLDEISSCLKSNSKDIDIFLWEKKELTKKQLSLLGNATVETFKIPQNTFGFLDGIKPAQGKRNVELFHNALVTVSEDLLFFMIIRQFRLLLGVSSSASIDEVKRLAPWQKSKLISQAKLFSPLQLKIIYKRLHEIDLAQKTGELTMPLTQTVDFFLLDI